MNIVHSLDVGHFGGITEAILTIRKFSRHNIDFWGYEGTMADEMRASEMKILTGGPDPWEDYSIIVGHGVGGWSYDGTFAHARSKGLKTIEYIHSNASSQTRPDLCDAFVGVSPLVDRLNQHMPNRRVIYGPIDDRFLYGCQRPDADQIGRLSRLVEDKNPRPFVELAHRFPSEKWTLAGGKIASAETEGYYNMIAASAPPNLTMVGYVRNFVEFYSHLKLYVYHTRDEANCMSVNMAMIAGVPVICQYFPQLVETTGGFCSFCNENQFADEIDRFLVNPAPFKEKAIAGREWAVAHAGLKATVGVWDDLCDSLVA